MTTANNWSGNLPFPSRGLGNYGDEAFDTAEDGSVDHDGPLELAAGHSAGSTLIRPSVFQVEAFGQVEIELTRPISECPVRGRSAYLYGPALPIPLQRIGKLEIHLYPISWLSARGSAQLYLRTVKRGIRLVDMPLPGHALLQHRSQIALCPIPDSQVTHPLLRIPGREANLELHPERLVYRCEEVETCVHLCFYLIDRAEDVCWEASAGCSSCRVDSPSSCTNRRTRDNPDSAPLASFRCNTPNSAKRMGSSL